MSTDPDESDDVFHPLGESWQDSLEDALEETEYDSELGMEMARDAMRVTKGELAEAEFHDRYHEEVKDEFGVDDRPIDDGSDDSSRLEGTLSTLGVDEDSRRDVLKKMGAGAGAVGFAAWGSIGDGSPAAAQDDEAGAPGDEEGPSQWGMTLDLEYCDGCLACVTACAEENNWDQGANWMYILDFEDTTEGGTNRLIRPCQHCTDAPCEKVCPTTARHTRDYDGLVLTDYAVCIGCRYCQVACPYGVNYFQWDDPSVSEAEIAEQYEDMEGDHIHDARDRPVGSRPQIGTMGKCTFCPSRQDGLMGEEMVGTAACSDACPPEVIQFGDMNNPESDPQRYADNPAVGRTLPRITSDAPSPDELEEALADADEVDDVESVTEAAEDLDEEILGVLLAVAVVGDDVTETGETSTLADQTATVLDLVDVLEEEGFDTADEDVLVDLDLAEEPDDDDESVEEADEEMAQEVLEDYVGGVQSTFKLLEEVGTEPNILYIGNEPGPNAEERETPVAYEDVGQTRRRKDVLDDETVGI